MVFIDKLIISVNQNLPLCRTSGIVGLTKLNRNILDCLEREGFIRGYEVLGNVRAKIFFKYRNGRSVFQKLTRISKPSRRVYSERFFRSRHTVGNFIISTPLGVRLVSKLHSTQKVVGYGGEVLIKIE